NAPTGRRTDPTAAERQRRRRARQRAAADALADPDQRAALQALPEGETRVMASQAEAVRRLEHATARAAYTGVLEANAGVLAARMVELALGGDVSCLIAVGSRLMPPARAEKRVRLPDLPPLTGLDACREAQGLIAAAAGRGEVGLDDAVAAQALVERVAEEHRQAMRDAALAGAGRRLGDATSVRLRVRELLPQTDGGEALVAEVGTNDRGCRGRDK
ncbi:MAG: hypothetical protein KDG89_10025, partial [Geminicoccaceae bacterium]|nr:hypothetical protein [Geminicoccaceae bacterium]